MSKSLFFHLMAVLAAVECSASVFQARIDLIGKDDGLEITPVGESAARVANPVWIKDRKLAARMIVAIIGADREWRKCTISFVADRDGRVNLFIRGAWNPDNRQTWTRFDEIRVDGAELVNGDFEQGTAGWYLERKKGPGAVLSRDAKSGLSSLQVSHDNSALQSLRVKAGRKVTIVYWYKAVEK